MAAKSELKLNLGYTDETTREIKIGSFAPAATSGFKTNIKNFNQNTVEDVSDLLLSDGGAPCTGIVAAEIVTETVRDINLNDAE